MMSIRSFFLFIALLTVPLSHYAQEGSTDDSFISFDNSEITQDCESCTSCSEGTLSASLPFQEFPFILVFAVVFILLIVKKNKSKVIFWTLGLLIFAALIYQVAEQDLELEQHQTRATTEQSNVNTTEEKWDNITETALADPANTGSECDEFETFSDFEETSEFETTSEFSEEFEAFDDYAEEKARLSDAQKRTLLRTSIALILTIIVGLYFRTRQNNTGRYLVLLSSLVYFGFYSGGCPCMISSFQNFILLLLGEEVQWTHLLWFLGLLPITYFLGKVWCGWVCHLGALQEFLYRPGKSSRMLSPEMQQAFKIIRLVAFLLLLVQIVLTRSNLFIKIDPFKVAFNLFSTRTSGYVLLGILLVSSLFVYRPFCRSLCPVGLMLAWVGKIPGAFGLKIKSECISCNKCKKDCRYQAIDNTKKTYTIDAEECIMCGDCVSACHKGAIASTTTKTH